MGVLTTDMYRYTMPFRRHNRHEPSTSQFFRPTGRRQNLESCLARLAHQGDIGQAGPAIHPAAVASRLLDRCDAPRLQLLERGFTTDTHSDGLRRVHGVMLAYGFCRR